MKVFAIDVNLHSIPRRFSMESDTEGPSYPDYRTEIETGLEVENIRERIEVLSREGKAQLIHRLIETLTIDEIATVLDEVAIRLHET
ncbi:MAG: hypothetical protein WBA76_02755 [Phormidesmis sp.]